MKTVTCSIIYQAKNVYKCTNFYNDRKHAEFKPDNTSLLLTANNIANTELFLNNPSNLSTHKAKSPKPK